MEWKAKIATSVLDGFRQCYSQDLFTDIEIEVSKAIFKCHKIFLCAISDFFHAMFTSGMRESVNDRIQLSGLSSATFRDVLTFYYNGDDSVITHDTVEELLHASGLLQLTCLQTRCEAYYANHFVPENAIGIWKLATCHGCMQLQQLSKKFILNNFTAVSQEAEFLTLEADMLVELLNDSDLKISSEDIVCLAAIKWIKHDLTGRSQHLEVIVSSLCLNLLSPNCFSNLVAFAKFTCASCSSLLQDCLERCHLSRLQQGTSEVTSGRCCRNYEEMLVVLGVHKATKMLPSVHAYSFYLCQWFKLDPLPFDPGVGYATCVKDSTIYISGISLRKGYMLKYDGNDNYWIEVSEMPDQRRYHEMVVLDNFVYAVGGCNKRDGAFSVINRYSIAEDCWKSVGHLQMGVYSASATAIGDIIFVFGGRAHGSIRRHEIQAYNTNTNVATVISSFASPVTESRALSVGCEAFVALTNGTVLKVSEDGNIYSHATIPNFDRYNFGFVKKMNSIMVVGGETRYPSGCGSGHFVDLIQIDLDSGKTFVMKDHMFASASAVCCCMVILHRTAFPKMIQPHL